MSLNELREICPVIFAEQPSNDVSDKYTHIPTNRVVEDMMQLGWDPINAQQVKARKNATRGFQKHVVVFRNENLLIKGKDGDDSYVQLLLTNSHDGKNAFTFTAGLFRMICENGLVISTNEFEKVSIRHMGYDFEELQKQINEMVEQLPLTVESMNKMIDTQMNQKSILKFAKDMLAVRFPEDELRRITIDMDEFITPVRPEDKGDDLWSVFNVIQEKIIEGDFEYTVGTKHRKARQIKNFKQDMELNSKMFDVALEYVNA